MKLIDRERVDGTKVTIGRRVHYENGRQRIARRFAAEYRDADGRQASETLRTTSKAQARRFAIEIQQRLESGTEKVQEPTVTMVELVERYLASVTARDLTPKTLAKYQTDLDKLKEFCREKGIALARRFGEDDLFRFRKSLIEKPFAPKTVQGAVVLTKQVFKWAWRQRVLRDYRLAAVSLPKAKAKPQPCFTTSQVENLIGVAKGEERAAFALMAYAGLRIGEVEQLRWDDVRFRDHKASMVHIRRGGSAGTTKDKDERFVPVHPRIAELLGASKTPGRVFSTISERILLARLKALCEACKFDNATSFKLHSFRHHFASLCANHGVAHRKALAWLGHSSSEMLDLYYHLHDDDSQQAMMALAGVAETRICPPASDVVPANGEKRSEGSLRAIGESRIEKPLQVPAVRELAECLEMISERAGFEPAVQAFTRTPV